VNQPGKFMPKFMNAELEAIRDNLECGHCGCKFVGSDSQAWKVKYEKRTVYCSTICRSAAISMKAQEQALREGKKPRKGALYGPCKSCGKMFVSQYDKMFCTMDCYIKSARFREMLAERPQLSADIRAKMAENRKKGHDVPCLECGKEFYQKRQTKSHLTKKFCTRSCYRSYFSKRFDRWIASPEGMALPQCYDEFLDRDTLKCLVEGCDWEGQSLTGHMNISHGVNASEFKRAVGFNLGTGVITRLLAKKLSERENKGIVFNMDESERLVLTARMREARKNTPYLYHSLEGKEHAKKTRVLIGAGPNRTCAECGHIFQQSTPFGVALYCSVDCRTKAYAKKRQAV